MRNEERYRKRFGLTSQNLNKAESALDHALDIRKFEIELYWKRAGYFWALIAVAFAGFFAVLASESIDDRDYYAYIIGVIGLVFTWAWFLVNRGSKFWQENWENHVDMLEDEVIGPLYKTILHRPKETHFIDAYITGPLPISVSKINQWVSLFTILIWIILVLSVLPEFVAAHDPSAKHIVVAIVGLAACFLMCCGGRSHLGAHRHKMRTRRTRIL
jgi:hypothetical protein